MTGQHALPHNEAIQPARLRVGRDTICEKACPRCRGDVLEFPLPRDHERAMCITCGWRRYETTDEVDAQVRAHLGRPNIGEAYHRR